MLYKLTNTEKFLTSIRYHVELSKYIYEDVLGLKSNSRPFSLIIFLLRNDRSFIYSPGALLPYIYAILPRNMKKKY